MDGVTILNTIPANDLSIPFWIFMVLMVVSSIVAIISFIKDEDAMLVVSIGAFCASLIIAFVILPSDQYPDRYEECITDDVSFNEFAQHYKIIDQRGEIYIVEERTMKGNN